MNMLYQLQLQINQHSDEINLYDLFEIKLLRLRVNHYYQN